MMPEEPSWYPSSSTKDQLKIIYSKERTLGSDAKPIYYDFKLNSRIMN